MKNLFVKLLLVISSLIIQISITQELSNEANQNSYLLLLSDQNDKRIIGDRRGNKKDWPFLVLIINKDAARVSTGTLIKPDLVLTSAYAISSGKEMLVCSSIHELKQYRMVCSYGTPIIHPEYDCDSKGGGVNDIGLIQLRNKIPILDDDLVKLQNKNSLQSPESYKAASWGINRVVFSNSNLELYFNCRRYLYEQDQKLISDQDNKNIRTTKSKFFRVTGNLFGSPGSPLLCGKEQIAVLSGDCALHKSGTILWTKIDDYLNWINKIIRESDDSMYKNKTELIYSEENLGNIVTSYSKNGLTDSVTDIQADKPDDYLHRNLLYTRPGDLPQKSNYEYDINDIELNDLLIKASKSQSSNPLYEHTFPSNKNFENVKPIEGSTKENEQAIKIEIDTLDFAEDASTNCCKRNQGKYHCKDDHCEVEEGSPPTIARFILHALNKGIVKKGGDEEEDTEVNKDSPDEELKVMKFENCKKRLSSGADCIRYQGRPKKETYNNWSCRSYFKDIIPNRKVKYTFPYEYGTDVCGFLDVENSIKNCKETGKCEEVPDSEGVVEKEILSEECVESPTTTSAPPLLDPPPPPLLPALPPPPPPPSLTLPFPDIEAPPDVETPPVIRACPVIKSPPVINSPPAIRTPPVIWTPPVIKSPPVINSPPAIRTPPVIWTPPAIKSPPPSYDQTLPPPTSTLSPPSATQSLHPPPLYIEIHSMPYRETSSPPPCPPSPQCPPPPPPCPPTPPPPSPPTILPSPSCPEPPPCPSSPPCPPPSPYSYTRQTNKNFDWMYELKSNHSEVAGVILVVLGLYCCLKLISGRRRDRCGSMATRISSYVCGCRSTDSPEDEPTYETNECRGKWNDKKNCSCKKKRKKYYRYDDDDDDDAYCDS